MKKNTQNYIKVNDMDLKDIVDAKELRVDKEGSRIWTVSAINGNLQRLKDVVEEIETSMMLAKNDRVVFLGNVIGEDSFENREVLDYIYEYFAKREEQVILIRGRNEERMVTSRKSFYQTPLGKNTISSYRVTKHKPFVAARHNEIDTKAFVNDRQWLDTWPCYFKTSKYYFVHSGVNPHMSLDKQYPQSAMWIDDIFYATDKKYEKLIVHFVNKDKSDIRVNRIGVASNPNSVTIMLLNDFTPRNMKDKDKIIEDVYEIKNTCVLNASMR